MTLRRPPRPTRRTVVSLQGAVPQTHSRFHALPAEIKNPIYELALTDVITAISSKTMENPEGCSEVPGILMACKHCYAEALQIHFSCGIFVLTSKKRMRQWLGNIGAQNRALISQIWFLQPCSGSMQEANGLFRSSERSDAERLIRELNTELERRRTHLGPGMLKLRYRIKYTGNDHSVYSLRIDENGQKQLVIE